MTGNRAAWAALAACVTACSGQGGRRAADATFPDRGVARARPLAPTQVQAVRERGFHLEAPRGWKVEDRTIGATEVLSVTGPETKTPPGPSIAFVIARAPRTVDEMEDDLVEGARQRWARDRVTLRDTSISVPFLGAARPAHRLSWAYRGTNREEVIAGATAGDRAVVVIEESPLTVSAQVGPLLRATRASFELDAESGAGAPASSPASAPASAPAVRR